ncbi:MFS transporter, SET family, sugar efflux transporter [Vibrio mimicus]|uniref:sugar efflux transporter n=1 Tax=Vibrio mimicus TaxID=674 RepID=UPI0002BC7436|nr:sugar efflux transporter [Vibrio mimicus]EMB50176.1 Permease of the major facilitator superfamily protein [Vibrio mimicus CAIM 602]MBY7673088.1 sugar efflux transporter [Vibrio mimicus]MBY7725136.1 sugar efflux transporter [Vibrio mimicus]TXY31966.1 MFS transporter [Vibrio mimicus]SUP10140.1 MFS transporter, SET family, sugar efflux transporter [Vibrio mimicus]
MYRDKTALLFIMSTLVTGLCGAFFYPLSSLFIVEALDASPMQLSLYMVMAVVSSVIVSQWLARQSDRHWQRKTILLVSLSCYFITVVSFIFIRSYPLAIMVVVLFASISGASFGQLFALGREYADRHLTDKTTFLSTMRAGIAIAWVFGPPAAFMLKASFGFSAAFAVSTAIVSLAIVLIARYLPAGEKTAAVQPDGTQVDLRKYSTRKRALIVLYCVTLVCTFGANNLYITSMPLYLSRELMVPEHWLGLLFGTAALCEIPVMLMAGKLAQRWGTNKLLMLGIASGMLFYGVMLTHTGFIAMIAAQVLNGFFIGVCATLGMVVLQDMMQDRLGTASTLFSSMLSISTLVASLSVGVVGEFYNYFSTLYVSLTGAFSALILLTLFSQLQRKTVQVESSQSEVSVG